MRQLAASSTSRMVDFCKAVKVNLALGLPAFQDVNAGSHLMVNSRIDFSGYLIVDSEVLKLESSCVFLSPQL